MKRLTNEQLDAIRERVEKATSGPWFVKYGLDSAEVFVGDKRWIVAEIPKVSNAEFIAHAREDVPKLIAEIERLNEAIQQLSENREKWRISHGELEADNHRLSDALSRIINGEVASLGDAFIIAQEAIANDRP
ncbi:hypothetical protein V7149_00460 [Bacillus sp. JJ1503]|uniref:hypothetical protein n=1 Tax=Bacillus sp. JJ1503 TaxID=3122956 RepID=UPI002FFD5925